MLGYWLGSAHDAQPMPDAAALAAAMRVVITVFMVLSVAAMWWPPRRARHDFPEWLTAINTLLIAGAMLVLAQRSRSACGSRRADSLLDTALRHRGNMRLSTFARTLTVKPNREG